jgi:excisionase family DNA binding protein
MGIVRLLNVNDVAVVLSISKRTVWRLLSSGELPAPVSIGRCKRWLASDVDAYVSTLKTK